MSKILYVEDDINLSFVTKDNLEEQGYEIIHCENGEIGLETFQNNSFDLCILDVMLPKMDGFSLAKKIRTHNQDVPIIFLTAKSQKIDTIEGLKTGADDYITKPFSIEELILRIEIFLKRNKITQNQNKQNQFQIGKHFFDFDDLLLSYKKETNRLTLKEGELLKYFCLNQNKILKREAILIAVWGKDDYFLGRSLDVFISRLRKYLKGSVQFENIHGVGFKMIVD